MKLFVVAALITISSAARLEQLELQKQLRQYLPPNRQNLGAQGNAINGVVGPIPGAPNAAGIDLPSNSDLSKYLPPGATASPGKLPFAGSLNGFGKNPSNALIDPEQPVIPAVLLNQPDAIPQGSNNFGIKLPPQLNAPGSTQEIPQQPFDEKTGYIY